MSVRGRIVNFYCISEAPNEFLVQGVGKITTERWALDSPHHPLVSVSYAQTPPPPKKKRRKQEINEIFP
jgi:hypothetical protein